MSESKIRNTISECMVGLTRHIMSIDGISHEEAYRKLIVCELFRLVCDPDTRLYLEPNIELADLYDLEMSGGREALYARINA